MTTPPQKRPKVPAKPPKAAKPVDAQKKAPSHVSALVEQDHTLTTSDGAPIVVWLLQVDTLHQHLSEWAIHFRQHYCLDSEIDALRSGTGLSRAEYLRQLIFPDK